MDLIYKWKDIKEGGVYYVNVHGWSDRIIIPVSKTDDFSRKGLYKWKVATYFLRNIEVLFSEKLFEGQIPNYSNSLTSRWNSRDFFDWTMFCQKKQIYKLNDKEAAPIKARYMLDRIKE